MPQKGTSTLRMRVCRQCGIEFMGGPRAWYCPTEAYKKAQHPIWAKLFAYENGWREWEKTTGRKAVLGNGSYDG